MTKEEIKKTIDTISMALCSSHNVLITDLYEDSDVDDKHWVSDHSKELELLSMIETVLIKNS